MLANANVTYTFNQLSCSNVSPLNSVTVGTSSWSSNLINLI